MNNLIDHPSTITTDRTGGRTKTGFEFEDLVELEGFDGGYDMGTGFHFEGPELSKNETISLPSSRAGVLPLQKIADNLIGALVGALEQIVPNQEVSRRILYVALSESLRDKLWQRESLPTGAVTLAVSVPERNLPVETVQSIEEDHSTSYQHESEVVAKAFLGIVSEFRPDTTKQRDLYADI